MLRWYLDARYRFYIQDKASFYSDFHQRDQNFVARDKELSSFSSHNIGVDVAYQFKKWALFRQPTLHFSADYLNFSYDDFYRYDGGQGSASLITQNLAARQAYDFDAFVVQIYLSSEF